MNRIIKTLIYSDFLILSAFSFYGPIFAIFITQQISGGSIKVVGFAAAAYWLVRAVTQLPISSYLDKNKTEKRNFWALISGSFLFSIVPFLFIFAKLPWHIYLLQCIYALGDSLAAPTYLSVFSSHLDKRIANLEWGSRSVSIGIGVAVASALGGYLADSFGFKAVFILTGCLAVLGSSFLIALKSHMLKV